MPLEDIIIAAIIKEIVDKVKGNERLKAVIRKALKNSKPKEKEQKDVKAKNKGPALEAAKAGQKAGRKRGKQ